jgi:chorismate mutase
MGLRADSRQGEKLFPAFLGRMGCAVWPQADGCIVEGASLRALDVNVGDVGDLVLPLAVVAAYAKGTSRFLEVGHLAHRESEQLAALVDGLGAMGIRSEQEGDVLAVVGGHPFGDVVDSTGDFRVASPVSNKTLVEMRNEVDDLDEQLLKLLEQRMELTHAIGRRKIARGLPVRHPRREEKIMGDAQRRARRLRLNARFVERVYALILAEARRIQEEIAKKEK